MSKEIKIVKPFKTYTELTQLLISRGMIVEDEQRLERKLTQVGYYRLSGYWYPCKEYFINSKGNVEIDPLTKKPKRTDQFLKDTSFNKVFDIYIMDKKLRLLMIDAIERIEIHLRSVIAHEIGEVDPLAYKNENFINPKETRNYSKGGQERNNWKEWLKRQNSLIDRNKEDFIKWHRLSGKELPFWAVVEVWDFGTMSKYFKMLKQRHQNNVCKKLGIDNPKILVRWLQEINILRNKCAHHSRIWNYSLRSPLPVLDNHYFNCLDIEDKSKKSLFGLISILWFLVHNIGKNSKWIYHVKETLDSKSTLPGCEFSPLSKSSEEIFPIKLFISVE